VTPGRLSGAPRTNVDSEPLGVLQVAEYLVRRQSDALVQTVGAGAAAANPLRLRHDAVLV